MRGTLGSLYCRRNLRVRGREQPGDLLGQRLVGGHPGKLVLPEIEITPGEPVEIGRIARAGIVAFGRHTITIAQA